MTKCNNHCYFSLENTSAVGPYVYCIYLFNDFEYDQNNTDASTQFSNEQYQSGNY